MTTRVLLIDDHAVLRGGLVRIVERTADLTVAGEAGSGPEAAALVRTTPAEVAVLDLDMPGGGLALIGTLRDLRPGLRILVLSQHGEREYALRCLEMGAHGYLNKSGSTPAEIETAIRTVAAGRRYLSELGHELALERVAGAPSAPHARLSSRELDVAVRLARGQRVRDIATELGISVKTVSTHRSATLRKLDLAGNVELAIYAREHGLI